ncbi:hypothetical protein AJ78_00343 [Emergomyces pasteurianus Ep9510]|uniref:Major facilitator superfamily (MFS) profile domain-containing protein n=1 Tax=Emergomyces pasteurianus Ep9510 TaxID=1447872 RepID=A0A1J9PTJ5_9EURO|nr:hypothetical protein AJ78_00343 [Emergomyces pasteurianus Ep9510]
MNNMITGSKGASHTFRIPDVVEDESQAIMLETRSLRSIDNPITQEDRNGSEKEAIESDIDMEVYHLELKAMVPLILGLMLAMFVVALDNTIIATAIPKLTAEFVALLDVGWYGSIYILCTVALQPTFGKIYSFWDTKYTFLTAIFIFEVGSVICAAATSSNMFIVGRAISGCGAAGVFSGVMTIVGYAARVEQRPACLAFVVSMFAVSAIVGPLLGGVLTDKASWRWCFWINPLIGSGAVVAVIVFFKSPKRHACTLTPIEKAREMDIPGSALLIGGCTCLLLALQQGGTRYAWADARIWGLLAIGFPLLIALFIYQQIRRGERATIPPGLFMQRTVLSCSLFAFFQMATVFVHVFYLPFYFQSIQGVSAIDSGIRSIPYLLANVVPAIVVAGVLPKAGYYTPFMIAGGIFAVVGAGLLYTLKVDSPAAEWIGYQIIAGFGVGLSAQLPIVAIQTILKPKDYPVGNAIYLFFQNLGGSITISIAQTILQNTLYHEIPLAVPSPISAQDVINAGVTNLRESFPSTVLAGILKAYMTAINRAFALPIAMAALTLISACFVEWKSVKGQKTGAATGV